MWQVQRKNLRISMEGVEKSNKHTVNHRIYNNSFTVRRWMK